MQEYEIRILSGGHTTAFLEVRHLSDHAAIRSARIYAGDKRFEVWRGLDCIYVPPRSVAETAVQGSPRL
jgi:hypothetical protein